MGGQSTSVPGVGAEGLRNTQTAVWAADIPRLCQVQLASLDTPSDGQRGDTSPVGGAVGEAVGYCFLPVCPDEDRNCSSKRHLLKVIAKYGDTYCSTFRCCV